MGVGWNVSGLSSITRVGKDIYHDNGFAPVDFSQHDRFALDGNRLFTINGTYGQSATTYRLEADNFSVATSFDMQGSGPKWFRVVSKDGLIKEYGKTSDSRFLTDNGTDVMIWYLSKVEDANGNFMEFEYANVQTTRKCFVKKIKYTGSINQSPYNLIEFNYRDRLDMNRVYQGGASVHLEELLDNIEIRGENNQLFKRYTFNYGHNDISSFLKEVVESAGSGESLNSTIFKYGEQPDNIPQPTTNLPSTFPPPIDEDGSDFFVGDYNGDGKSDILAANYVQSSSSNFIKYHTGLNVFLNVSSNNFQQGFSLPLAQDSRTISNPSDPNYFGFVPADYNGDGLDDIMIMKTDKFSDHTELLSHDIHYAQAGGNFNIVPDLSIPAPTANTWLSPKHYFFTGDFDGDNRTDFINFLYHYGGIEVAYVSFPAKGEYHMPITIPSQPFYSVGSSQSSGFWAHDIAHSKRIYITDFNGDGRQDLMCVEANETIILAIIKNSSGQYETVRLKSSGYPTDFHQIYPGDFNGDGKTDMLTRAGTSWEVAYSTGKDFVLTPFIFNTSPVVNQPAPSDDDKIVIADFNGDGKSDILHAYDIISSQSSELAVYYSTGINFHSETTSWGLLAPSPLILGDFNGDGRLDIINRHTSTSPFRTYSFKSFGKERLLEKVADGMGRITEFQYSLLTAGGNFYNKGGISSYPLNKIQIGSWFLSALGKPNAGFGQNVTSYRYEQAMLHKEGKGFLGFKKVTSINSLSDARTESLFEVDNTYYFPYQVAQNLFQNSTNSQISSTTYSMGTTATAPKCYFQKLNSSSEFNMLTGATTTTTNQYDNFGNVTQSSVNVDNIASITTTTGYVAANSTIHNKPSQITITKSRSGSATVTDVTTFSYDGLGRLAEKIEFANKPLWIKTVLGYDQYGNIVTETVTGASIPDVAVVTKVFDSKGRFPEQTKNSLNQISTTTWNSLWGQPEVITGIDGVTIVHHYNLWGRLTSTDMPGYTIGYSEAWDINNGAYWHSLQTHPGRPDVKTSYDILGREIRREVDQFNTQKVVSSITYNSKGQVASTEKGHLTSEGPSVTSYTYTTRGNIETATSNQGVTAYSYSYGNGKVTTNVTNPAGLLTTVRDATGKVVEQSDNGGKLTYTYDSRGNVLVVKHGATTLMTNTYDAYGRRTGLLDCDAGQMVYTFDAWGRLISEKDAKNQTPTVYTYNVLNQLTKRIGPEGTTTYQYYDLPGYANQLKSITGFSGVTDMFNYDNKGNLIYKGRTIDSKTFAISFGHNLYGDITEVTYHTGFHYENVYDQNGILQKVTTDWTGSTVDLFNAVSINGHGQYTSYKLGNGKITTNSFSNGFLNNISVPGVQNLDLNFDQQTGNLNWRHDNLTNFLEEFTYDNLNRLTSSTVHFTGAGSYSMPAHTIAYDLNSSTTLGNITDKTGPGHYTYGSFPRHGVKSVTNPQNSVSILQQDIEYTPFRKIARAVENSYEQTFTYDGSHQRAKSQLKQGTSTLLTRYYWDDFELNNNTNIYYVAGGDGLCAIIEHDPSLSTPVQNIHYLYKDHLGSIVAATDQNGNIEARQNFDAWGRSRKPDNLAYNNVPVPPSWLYRGFTSHEHMPEFGLVNMNGRVYDPILGRMLSPDNFLMPTGTQGHNRYTYANNNPLKYTDPTGNFLKPAMFATILIGDFISNVIYGSPDALGSAYTRATTGTEEMANCMQFNVYSSEKTAITAGFSPFDLGISANLYHVDGDFDFNASVGYGLITGPYAGVGLGYSAGDWRFGVSGSTNFDTYAGGAGATYTDGDFSIGYYQSYHGGNSNKNENNWNGGFRVKYGDFSIREENDFLAVGHSSDKGRTQALEIGYGVISVGSSIYTNDGATEGDGSENEPSRTYGLNQTDYDAWKKGKVYIAPLYLGVNIGNSTSRFGFSHWRVQDVQQNGVHQSKVFFFGNQHYYRDYTDMYQGIYLHSGYNNPFSLYGY